MGATSAGSGTYGRRGTVRVEGRRDETVLQCVLSDLDRGEVAAPTEEVARGVDGAAGGRGFVVRRWNVTPGPPDLAR